MKIQVLGMGMEIQEHPHSPKIDSGQPERGHNSYTLKRRGNLSLEEGKETATVKSNSPLPAQLKQPRNYRDSRS